VLVSEDDLTHFITFELLRASDGGVHARKKHPDQRRGTLQPITLLEYSVIVIVLSLVVHPLVHKYMPRGIYPFFACCFVIPDEPLTLTRMIK
jgi:hypothetical protein